MWLLLLLHTSIYFGKKMKVHRKCGLFQHHNLMKFSCNNLNLKKQKKCLQKTWFFLLLLLFSRWLGEPVKCLILQTSFFLVNKKGYPVLPRALQNMVRQFYPLRVQFIIEGKGCFYEPLSNATFIFCVGDEE